MRKTTTTVHDSRTWSNSIYKKYLLQSISLLKWFPLHMHMHFQFFYFFSEHIRMAASNYHSNLSIILDIFRKKNVPRFICSSDYKASVNLRQFVIIIKCYTMIATLDEIWVITCWVKGNKRTKKLTNTNVFTRHDAIAMSRDLHSWRSSFSPFKHIYYFQFLIFEIIRFVVWFYVLSVIFPRLLISLNFVSLICF